MKKYTGECFLLLSSLIWGFTFISQYEAMQHVGPMTFVALRFGIGAVVLLPLLYLGRLRVRTTALPQPTQLSHWLCTGSIGLCLFLGSACQQIGLQHTTVANAGFLTSLYLIIVPLVGFALKKPPSLIQLLSILVAFIGVCFLNGGINLTQLNIGDLWNLAGTLFWTGQIWTIAYYSQRFDNGFLAIWQAVLTCGLAAIAAFWTESVQLVAIIKIWYHLIVAGVLASGLAYGLQIYGQRLVSPHRAVSIFALEGVMASLFAFFLLDQVLSTTAIIGCGIILIATVMAQIQWTRKKTCNTLQIFE